MHLIIKFVWKTNDSGFPTFLFSANVVTILSLNPWIGMRGQWEEDGGPAMERSRLVVRHSVIVSANSWRDTIWRINSLLRWLSIVGIEYNNNERMLQYTHTEMTRDRKRF